MESIRKWVRKLPPLQRRLGRAWTQNTRALFQDCGAGFKAGPWLRVTAPGYVVAGSDVRIGEGVAFQSEGGLTIGNGAALGDEVTIITRTKASSGKAWLKNPVHIGQGARIGNGAVLHPGVTIGNGVEVAAGSQVTRSISAEESSSADAKPPAPVFFLGTGRSGSMTVARTLDQHAQVSCRHEPRPQLIRLSTEFAHGEKSRTEVMNELAHLYLETARPPSERVLAESDQKYWNLVPLLAELMPEAKFVWLIRNGLDTARSTTARGWFTSEEQDMHGFTWDEDPIPLLYDHIHYRLDGESAGIFNAEEWKGMNTWARNSWYWGYVNGCIQKSLEVLPPERSFVLRLEDLSERISDLLTFLGVRDEPLQVDVHNRGPVQEQVMSQDEKAEFAAFGAALMAEFYPEEAL